MSEHQITEAEWERLKATYPNVKYRPDPKCRKCHGKGEYEASHTVRELIGRDMDFCACLYLHPDDRDLTLSILRDVVTDIRKAVRGE